MLEQIARGKTLNIFSCYRSVSLLFLLFITSASFSADFTMWVGEEGSYEMIGTGYYNFRLTRVSCTNPSVSCNTVGWLVKWKVQSYFSGTASIIIEYAYQVSSSSSYKNDRKTLTVSCRDNQVTVDPNRLTLSPGEYRDLTYSFQSRQYVSRPTIQWSTDDWNGKIITVSSSGRVKAIGPGTATVYLDHDQGSNRGTCVVTVKQVNPERVTLNNSLYLTIGETKRLSPTLYPDGASTTYSWYSDDSSVASVDQSGNVTGISEGATNINVRTANNLTASCYVTVSKPSFNVTTTSPASSATGVSVLTSPTITFSSQPQWASGKSSSDVTLTNINTNTKVSGSAVLSGKTLRFSPAKALDPQTNYRLTIPSCTLIDLYGTQITYDYSLSFKTGDREKLTISASLEEGWVTSGSTVTLSSNSPNAQIRYTTNGSTPTQNSALYTSPILVSNDLVLKAIAFCDGFDNSEVLTKTYKVATLRVVEYTPQWDSKEIGRYVIPSVIFNEQIVESKKISGVELFRGNELVSGTAVVQSNTLFFVPTEELKNGKYRLFVPEGAIQSLKEESNKEIRWSMFTIENTNTNAVMGSGPYMNGVVASDNTLWGWGKSWPIESSSPKMLLGDVRYVSMGEGYDFISIAAIKTDDALWTWGDNYYGILGDGTTDNHSSPVKVMENVSSVATDNHMLVLKKDGTVWSCGYNACGQLGNGQSKKTVNSSFSRVQNLSDVIFIAAAFQLSAAITSDGGLWIWGRTGYSGFGSNSGYGDYITTPKKMMNGVKYVHLFTQGGLAIKEDNTLWYWGWYEKPKKLIDNVSCAIAVGGSYLALKTDGTLWAWGQNTNGTLGNGTTTSTGYADSYNKAIKVMNDVVYIWGTYCCAYAIKKDGSVWSWGSNKSYMLGNGNTDVNYLQLTPVQIMEGKKSYPLLSVTTPDNEIVLKENSKGVVEIELNPWNADYDRISFSSSNENVATINNRGIISAIKKGTATILAMVDNKKASVKVTVVSSTVSGDLNQDGEVNGTDLVALVSMILGKNPKTAFGDVNGDGQVNGTDIVALVSIILKK